MRPFLTAGIWEMSSSFLSFPAIFALSFSGPYVRKTSKRSIFSVLTSTKNWSVFFVSSATILGTPNPFRARNPALESCVV